MFRYEEVGTMYRPVMTVATPEGEKKYVLGIKETAQRFRQQAETLINISKLGRSPDELKRLYYSVEILEVVREEPAKRLTPTQEDCCCDGASYHTAEENAKRHPFLTNDDCLVHGTPLREDC